MAIVFQSMPSKEGKIKRGFNMRLENRLENKIDS
jgi:hypothetical protein